MPHAFVQKLVLPDVNLGKEVTLLFTFDGNMKGIYEQFFPVVCWLTTFGQTGRYRMLATYTSQLAFSSRQVNNGNIVDAESCVEINDSETTTLTEKHRVFRFSNPVEGVAGCLEARNETGSIQDISLGFMSPGEFMPKPVLYFKDVEDGSRVTAKFTPVLRAYITPNYEGTAILQSAIDTPVIWEQNLAALSESTTWNLKRDPATGRYTITQAYRGMSHWGA
ncbi:uncharacterized protein EDB91DRAFT_1171462 [Suillus paluster]|uniref:uncharacterized protein n=1 Tax=Suillus paluster TaxID=48578 RepID=UPI001B884B1B|nr:uncharacterized protein EDB91DRAFT_1171462 [Suillus paluster]KAG1724086.1 hypothetical protein EDB91DRAFT_1171462 [Suillus paluster]